MSAKHTPGPWTTGNGAWASRVMAPSRYEAKPTDIGQFSGNGREEDEANAKLAAAAPELLEALEGVEPYLEEDPDDDGDYNERVRAVRAAITRSKGN